MKNVGQRVDIELKNDRRRRGYVEEPTEGVAILRLSGTIYTPEDLKKELNYITIICSKTYYVDLLKKNGFDARESNRYTQDFHITLCGAASDAVIREHLRLQKPVSNIIEDAVLKVYTQRK